MNTDKIAAAVHIMDLETEVERLRGCWVKASKANDKYAMAFFERAAKGIKSDIEYAKRSARTL